MDPVRIPPLLFNQDKRNGFKRSSWSDNVDTDTATGSKHLAGCQSVPVSQTRPRRHPSPPKVKAAAKSKAPVRCKVSTETNSLETASSVPAVTPTPTSLTPVDAKGGVKRAREDEGDGTTQGYCICAISEDGSDWVGPPNGEARKRDEQAENVKTREQALTFFETVIKFIDGKSGREYINNTRPRDV